MGPYELLHDCIRCRRFYVGKKFRLLHQEFSNCKLKYPWTNYLLKERFPYLCRGQITNNGCAGSFRLQYWTWRNVVSWKTIFPQVSGITLGSPGQRWVFDKEARWHHRSAVILGRMFRAFQVSSKCCSTLRMCPVCSDGHSGEMVHWTSQSMSLARCFFGRCRTKVQKCLVKFKALTMGFP